MLLSRHMPAHAPWVPDMCSPHQGPALCTAYIPATGVPTLGTIVSKQVPFLGLSEPFQRFHQAIGFWETW